MEAVVLMVWAPDCGSGDYEFESHRSPHLSRSNMTDLIFRLRERARIRRQIPSRKSVQEGKPDRIADLLDEAADRLTVLEEEESHARKSNQAE